MRVLGVTGTNGKTTTTYLLEAIGRAAGERVGVIGTVGARIAGETVATAHTTPEASDLQALLARMRDAAVATVAMEVSSHALEQHRVDGVQFAAVCFTNLSHEHLDYHGTLDAYFEAKARLFDPRRARRGGQPRRSARRRARGAGAQHRPPPLDLRGRRRLRRHDCRDAVVRAGRHRVHARRPPRGRAGLAAPPPRRPVQPRERARGRHHRTRGRLPLRRGGGRARAAPGRAGPVRAGRRRPALHRPGRLRPHARRPGPRAGGGPPARRRRWAAGVRVRVRWRPRPGQAAVDGRRGRRRRRRRRAHLRQPALGGSAGDRRRRPPRPRFGARLGHGGARPPRGHRHRARHGRARRRRRGHGQGPRDRPDRAGPHAAVRRPRRRRAKSSEPWGGADRATDRVAHRRHAPRRRPRRARDVVRHRLACPRARRMLRLPRRGARDGHDYVPDAVVRGARASRW